ncbi:LrgB family protein [Spongorhabdus nitratireducens]
MIAGTGLCYLLFTVLVYLLCYALYRRYRFPLFNPVLLSIVIIAGTLLVLKIPYSHYQQGGDWLIRPLGIAVVALGVPLYEQMKEIRRELPGVILIVGLSCCLALTVTVLLALAVGADEQVAISLAPKSVTTPIAVMIAEHMEGGIPALTAIAVIITGLTGAIVGVPLLSLMKITSPKARGIAMGTACHAIGTARIVQDSLQQGAYSALALVLSASLSALLAPVVVPFALKLFG